eukprot:evm.model.scf_174.1 EVM.evm.TU.scf_174.1   scf_174:5351-12206(-)
MDSRRFEEAGPPGGGGGEDGRPLDVAFVGANLTNLASAAALTAAFEGIRIKVYDEVEDLQQVDDFFLTLSPGALKALNAISSIAAKAVLQKELVHCSGVGLEDAPWDCEHRGMPACSLRALLGLLGSLLPAGALCLGTRLEGMAETPEGVTFKEGGEAALSKLVVRSPDCPLSNTAASTSPSTGFVEADVILQLEQDCPPEWRSGDGLVVCHPLPSGDVGLSCLAQTSAECPDGNVDGVLRLLRTFPGLDTLLDGSPRVTSWTARHVFAPMPEEAKARGRIISTGGVSERVPCLSPHRAESAFTDALLLRCSLSDKGLTPAALREFEGLKSEHRPWKGIAKEDAAAADWLRAWGLLNSAEHKTTLQHAPGDGRAPCASRREVAVERGLRSGMSPSGMGWRIVS